MTSPSTTSALARAIVASDISHAGSTSAAAATTTNTSAPMRVLRQAMSDLPRLRPGEEAIRPEHQDQRHHRIDHKQFELREKMHRGRTADPDDERADKGAFDRPQS